MFWWVALDLFSLECNEMSSSGFWGVYGFGMALYLVLWAVFLHCWRISMVCLALELVGSWVDLGFNVWRLLDELLSIKVAWNQEFSGVLVFLGFGFNPSSSGFQSYSSLKTSPSIQHR